MPIPQTEAIKEAYASAPSNVVLLETIELRHPAFMENGVNVALRFVNDHADLTATLEATAPMNPGEAVLFTALAFEPELPGTDTEGAPELKLRICNATREILQYAREAALTQAKLRITYRIYLNTDTSQPHSKPFTATGASVSTPDATTVQLTCRLTNLSNKRFPGQNYTPQRFPGLVAT
jgi:hypothetical protein